MKSTTVRISPEIDHWRLMNRIKLQEIFEYGYLQMSKGENPAQIIEELNNKIEKIGQLLDKKCKEVNELEGRLKELRLQGRIKEWGAEK